MFRIVGNPNNNGSATWKLTGAIVNLPKVLFSLLFENRKTKIAKANRHPAPPEKQNYIEIRK